MNKKCCAICLAISSLIFADSSARVHSETIPAKIEFNRDIRPILSDNCFQCHGPDKSQRKSDLRLDIAKHVFADRGDYQILVPGDITKSKLWQRITAKRKNMPPPRTGKKLTPTQIALIQRWIEQGAKYDKHWSQIAPKRPPLPVVKNKNLPRNAIDHFVLARLEKENLQPNRQADRRTLIRRVTLDLSGLPPTIKEVEDFVNDRSPRAYEKVVDRLLRSPRYGERMALPWLDAARYADTNGYQADGERFMWRWRDWVIQAFNKNLPYDQFVIDQIAGDLLANPTLDQLIATGFNRNHRGNAEGGIIPEEYLVEYVVDRVDTTATVFLGLTAGCARCHDHKYDPISQKEFYQLFAYFNNIPERGKVVRFGNSPPIIKAPTPEQQKQWQGLQKQITKAKKECRQFDAELALARQRWETAAKDKANISWTLDDGMKNCFPFDNEADKNNFKYEAGQPQFEPGKIDKAMSFDGKRYVDAGDVAAFGFYDKFTFSVWIYATDVKQGAIFSRMKDTDRAEGYGLVLDRGAVQLNLVQRWLDDSLRVQTQRRLKPNHWYHLAVTYDGSRVAKGVRIYINGQDEKLRINLDDLNQTFKVDAPFRIGSGGGENRFRGKIDDLRIYERALSAVEVGIVSAPATISEILTMPSAERSPFQAKKLEMYFLREQAPEPIRAAYERLHRLTEKSQRLDAAMPTVMVMQEQRNRKPAHVLIRGEYDKKGERVQRGVPSSLPPLPRNAPDNRLGFARWLVAPENPLTARVAVNRFWQMYFGAGLVKTTEDFGSQGQWPSHPQLLDWLAVEFRDSGWNVKALQKLIVMSATYQQSSHQESRKKNQDLIDADNRLLSRGPRVRLSAQAIRDQALFISGLLVEKVGGPSVKPYQPDGLWLELSGNKYKRDKGEKLYRRSLYTFWKRTAPPPNMLNLDAAGRESCVVRQSRTNTPLQALNLMNDTAFVEASRVLAQHMMTEGGKTPAARIAFAFQLATARPPRPAEERILLTGFAAHHHRYRNDIKAARELVQIGDAPTNEDLPAAELAAYTAIASVILNLDETITKQ